MGPSEGLIGQQIAQYRIVDQIGEGGMGVVYRAEDTMLDRSVAMKFLPASAGHSQDAKDRFVHEAKAASALDHPNIATIFEIGHSESGQMFIAMAYYEGLTVEDMIEDGPMPVVEAVGIITQVAAGLARAHEDGIVHRDIKPGNIIVTSRNLAKILDFGVAKMQDVTMTVGTPMLGTLAYMSPEQARNETVDSRTDLWALGVVLYEMLAGRRPFAGGYEAAILYAAAHEPHDPIAYHRPDVPEWLGAIIDRLLQKNPNDRYATADDLIAALAAGPEAPAAPPSAEHSAETPSEPAPAAVSSSDQAALATASKKRPVLWGAAAAAAVLVIALLGWGIGQLTAGGSDRITDEDRLRARELHTNALDLRSRRQFALAQAELEQALVLDSTYSEAWSTLAAVDIALQDYDNAVLHSRKAVLLEDANPVAWFNLAFALEELGRFEEAKSTYAEAIRVDAVFVPAYSALGNRLIEQNQIGEAMGVLLQGLTAAPNSPLKYLLMKNVGKAHLAVGRNDEAVDALEEAVRLNPGNAESLSLLARAYEVTGRPDQARSYWELYIDVETDPAKRREAQERLE